MSYYVSSLFQFVPVVWGNRGIHMKEEPSTINYSPNPIQWHGVFFYIDPCAFLPMTHYSSLHCDFWNCLFTVYIINMPVMIYLRKHTLHLVFLLVVCSLCLFLNTGGKKTSGYILRCGMDFNPTIYARRGKWLLYTYFALSLSPFNRYILSIMMVIPLDEEPESGSDYVQLVLIITFPFTQAQHKVELCGFTLTHCYTYT